MGTLQDPTTTHPARRSLIREHRCEVTAAIDDADDFDAGFHDAIEERRRVDDDFADARPRVAARPSDQRRRREFGDRAIDVAQIPVGDLAREPRRSP